MLWWCYTSLPSEHWKHPWGWTKSWQTHCFAPPPCAVSLWSHGSSIQLMDMLSWSTGTWPEGTSHTTHGQSQSHPLKIGFTLLPWTWDFSLESWNMLEPNLPRSWCHTCSPSTFAWVVGGGLGPGSAGVQPSWFCWLVCFDPCPSWLSGPCVSCPCHCRSCLNLLALLPCHSSKLLHAGQGWVWAQPVGLQQHRLLPCLLWWFWSVLVCQWLCPMISYGRSWIAQKALPHHRMSCSCARVSCFQLSRMDGGCWHWYCCCWMRGMFHLHLLCCPLSSCSCFLLCSCVSLFACCTWPFLTIPALFSLFVASHFYIFPCLSCIFFQLLAASGLTEKDESLKHKVIVYNFMLKHPDKNIK